MAISSPRIHFLVVLLVFLLSISLSRAEIRFSEIRSDGRSIIPFDEFGFTNTGRLELNVSCISFSNPNPDLSQLDFFLSTRDSWHLLRLVHQNPRYVEEQRVTPSRLDDMHHSVDPSSALRNGRPSMLRSTHTADDASAHDGSMDLSVNMLLTQNSEMGMLQAMNGMAIKSEPGYSSSSSFVYGATDGNVLETHSTIGEASITSFSSTESNSQALNESSLDANFGFLRQIPRNFSLSDLTADFCQSSDIMENYSRSPFLDADDFPDSPGKECQGENKRLDTISESLSYEDFGSD